ncbi:MAG: beta-ketoacyl-ACP synthase II [Bacteroidales bacterium]|jgi:3-oxoacyl-[acyl-carrier-protein] synthase II|nr:beta-ketoacyl-ACP synthase II [Bacteroidales bacterium]MBR6900273.1 beta-ketoacyl-ACP synthase II [Bacteroidales bacterium]
MELKRVVVTGLGALTPIGNNVPALWDALVKGVSGAGPITHFDASKFRCQIASELKGFDPLNFFDKKEMRLLDGYTVYGLVTVDEAMRDSGLDDSNVDKDRFGVIWGSGMGGVKSLQDELREFALSDGNPRFSPYWIPKVIVDICAGQIAIRYGLRGPNYSTTAACATSAVAIGDAFNLIRLGKVDAMIAGGSECAVVEAGIGGFGNMRALSTRNDDPQTASRPYDKDRDGFVLGEGAGALILEELEHAKARGAHIYAEITGTGLSADAFHITASHPDGLGVISAMRQAVEESGMAITDVDHINTHGTSTPIGDISEPKAIMGLFGDYAYKIAINSTKSMTGHLLGAAGAVEAIATILTIKNGIVPPTINHFTDDPQIPALDFTFNKAQRREVNFAISNAFGFGGHNVCLAFRKY